MPKDEDGQVLGDRTEKQFQTRQTPEGFPGVGLG